MHSPFLLSRGRQIHTAEPLVLSTLVRPKGWLTRGQPSVADDTAIFENDDKRREGDYYHSVRRLRWQGTDARPCTFGGLRRPAPFVSSVVLRLEGSAHLVFHSPHVSLLSPIDPLACTPELSLHWAWPSPTSMCAPTHRHLRFSRFPRNAFTTSTYFLPPPSQLKPTPSIATSFRALMFIIN